MHLRKELKAIKEGTVLTEEPNPWAVGMYHGAPSEFCVGTIVCDWNTICTVFLCDM